MIKLNLASLVKRPSRRPIVLANIATTKAQADTLAALYLGIVAEWANATDRILAAYSLALSKLVTDSANDIGSLLDEIGGEIQRLVLTLTPSLRLWALQVEAVHRGKWVSNVLSASSVDLSTILSADDVSETVDAAVNWNVSLVRDVSEEQRRRIANAVFTGLQQRKSAADVAKEIREATGMARARARRVASDQTSKLGAQLNKARQLQAGITHFRWRHGSKVHYRPWHLARDGKVFSWENPGIPPDDMPSIPPWCSCTAQAIILPEEDQE